MALLACFPALARAQSEPAWYSHTIPCEDKGAEQDPLPPELSKEAVLKDLLRAPLIRKDDELERVCAVFGKAWKAQKEPTFLAFAESALYQKEEDRDHGRESDRLIRVAMYRRDLGGRYQLVARTTEPVSFGGRERRVRMLDFARYKVTPTEYAFGVRARRDFGYSGGAGQNEWLQVFRIQGAGIQWIMRTLVHSSSDTSQPVGDGTRDMRSNGDQRTAEISVLKTRSHGFFDWKITLGDRSAILRWDGTLYEIKGKDPVEDVNPID
jgi:hypothetical protein